MDEISDRIKATKIKKKDLFFLLIVTEIVGILSLFWFLRIPLSQKYLADSPRSYSIDSMDQSKQYLFKQGDFITGTAGSSDKLQILLIPNGSKYSLSTNPEGNFAFQIPTQTKPQEYRLLILKNSSGSLESVKNLRIRVASSNKLTELLSFIKLPPFL